MACKSLKLCELSTVVAALLMLGLYAGDALAKRNARAERPPEATSDQLERAIAAYEAAPRPDPSAFAEALDRLSGIYQEARRFNDAERLLQQGIGMLERRLGVKVERNPLYDALINDLGGLYRATGRLTEAEALLRRALSIRQAQFGVNHPAAASTMFNLGNLLNTTSRYAEAEELYRGSLVIFEKALRPDDPLIAKVLTNFANNYIDQGRTADALGLQLRVLAIHEKTLGPTALEVALILPNIANSYVALERYSEAGPLYERALRIYAQLYGPDSPQSAIALASAGRLAQREGRADEAEAYLNRALAALATADGSESPLTADFQRSLAFLDLASGNTVRARVRFERALAILQARLGDRHLNTIAAMTNVARVAGVERQWLEALTILRTALESAKDFAASSGGLSAHKSLSNIDRGLIEALWHVSNGQPDGVMTDEAFAAAQRAHESQAGAALAQMAVRFAAGDDAIAALVRRQQDLRAALASLDQRITGEVGMRDGKRNDRLIVSLRAESANLQASLEATSLKISRDLPDYGDLSSPAPLSIVQIQSLLKSDEVLVSFASANSTAAADAQSYVFAVTRDSSAWHSLALGADAIAGHITKLRAGLFNPDPNASGPAPFDLAASHEFYTTLLGPVESILAGKSKLLVVPVGALTSLPFQVLVTKPPDPAVALDERYRKAAWLINDKAITVLPAVSSLRALRRFVKASTASRPFIGFGDPVFQRGGDRKRKVARALQPYQSYYKGAAVDYDMLRRSLPALPDTADELRAVAAALGAGDGDIRLGAAASVTNVMTASLQNYRVLDFATHGLIAGQVDGLSEPALVLSVPDRPTAEDDGLLTASRVARLNLDADWAVLSACNTAAGDSPGAEGLSGLARAFFYAGARALLVSHWPLESEAAVKLTTGAFSQLAKEPSIGRAEALRRSMRALIEDPLSTRNADPSVWAPFVLVGGSD